MFDATRPISNPLRNPKGTQNIPKLAKREPQGANEPPKTPLASRVEQNIEKGRQKTHRRGSIFQLNPLESQQNSIHQSAQNAVMEIHER